MAKPVAAVKPTPVVSNRNKPTILQGTPPKGSVHQIVEGLLPLAVSLKDIKPDPANERTHARANLDAVRGSLQKFGQREPLVVNARTGRIEAGHGRYTVMIEMGWTHCAAIVVDDDPKTAAGFRIAANRTAELAGWDDAKLMQTLQTLKSESFNFGFDDSDIERIKNSLDAHEKSSASIVSTHCTCPKCGKGFKP